MSWDLGRYETVAEQLLPAALAVVEHAAPRAGEVVVDVGCGTGNAALLAAARGARVTGVDPAERLLDVARAEAAARGLDATFLSGVAGALPVADAGADAVISVFGVIFAPDAENAVAEMIRITAPDGRIVFSAWIPEGPIASVMRLRGEAIARASGVAPGPPPFAWHDRAALETLFGRHGLSVELAEHEIAFSGSSARDYLDAQQRDHPMWVQSRDLLQTAGELEAVHAKTVALLEAANEVGEGFRISSRYVVATARRASAAG